MKREENFPTPPWDMEHAAARLTILEKDYNSLDIERIARNFATDAEVRFGADFINGREQISEFLVKKWSHYSGFNIQLDLWGALKGRMAVRFEFTWSDDENRNFIAYGVQVFQFDDLGYITQSYASFNDVALLD